MKKYSIFFFLILLLAAQSFSQTNRSSVKEVYISKIPKPMAPPNLIISDISFSDKLGNYNLILDANEQAEISFSISNVGKGDAYNLIAIIKAISQVKGIEYPKELIIGKLSTDEKTTISIPITGSMQLETGKEEFEILIKEGNNFDADPFKVSFNTHMFKSPLLKVADYNFTTDEEGKIKLGHSVSLNIVVQNQGQGEATNVNISFVNPNNVFPANETSFRFNLLKPNESKVIVYEFFANRKYSGNEIPIQVIINEHYNKYGEIKTLAVDLEQPLSKTQHVNIIAQYENEVIIENVSLTSDVDKNIPLNSVKYTNRYALIIGNEDYSSRQKSLSSEVNVAFAVNDAKIFKEYCVSTLGIEEKNVFLLTNATAGEMHQRIELITQILSRLGNKGELLFFYAGHGHPDENSREPFLMPVDVSASNLSSAIKLYDVYKKFSQTGAKKITVFLDACFTGGGRESGLLAARAVRVRPKESQISGNIVIFAATSEDQSALPFNEKQHGMFTYFLLKKLQETKGHVDYGTLEEYLSQNVSLESLRVNHKAQDPKTSVSPQVKNVWESWKLQ